MTADARSKNIIKISGKYIEKKFIVFTLNILILFDFDTFFIQFLYLVMFDRTTQSVKRIKMSMRLMLRLGYIALFLIYLESSNCVGSDICLSVIH